MEDIGISVIIPCKDVPINKVRRCLDSIVCQGYRNLEVIFVDDCSTEENSKLYTDLLSQFPYNKVKYTKSNENKGILQSRIIGFELGTKEWIWNIDADDYISPSSFDTLSYFVNIRKEELDYPDIYYFYVYQDTGKLIPRIKDKFITATRARELFFNERGIQGYTVTKLINENLFGSIKSKLEQCGKVNMGEDQLLTSYLLAYNTKNVVNLNMNLYSYEDLGITKKFSNPSEDEQLEYYDSVETTRSAFDVFHQLKMDIEVSKYNKCRNQILYSICRISHNDYCDELLRRLLIRYGYDTMVEYNNNNNLVFENYMDKLKSMNEELSKDA